MDKTQAMIHEMKAAYDWINAGEFYKAKKHLEFALDYLHDIEAAEHTLAGGRLQLVRVFDESEVEETGVGEYQVKSAAAQDEPEPDYLEYLSQEYGERPQ